MYNLGKKHAFTYLELIIAMTFISIIMAISVPYFFYKPEASSTFGEFRCFSEFVPDGAGGGEYKLFQQRRYNNLTLSDPVLKEEGCEFVKPTGVTKFNITLIGGGGGGTTPFSNSSNVYSVTPAGAGNVIQFTNSLASDFDATDSTLRIKKCKHFTTTPDSTSSYTTEENYCIGDGGVTDAETYYGAQSKLLELFWSYLYKLYADSSVDKYVNIISYCANTATCENANEANGYNYVDDLKYNGYLDEKFDQNGTNAAQRSMNFSAINAAYTPKKTTILGNPISIYSGQDGQYTRFKVAQGDIDYIAYGGSGAISCSDTVNNPSVCKVETNISEDGICSGIAGDITSYSKTTPSGGSCNDSTPCINGVNAYDTTNQLTNKGKYIGAGGGSGAINITTNDVSHGGYGGGGAIIITW